MVSNEEPGLPRIGHVAVGPGAGRALLGFVVLSVLLTWPLAAHMTDALPLGNNDLFQNLWNFWLWKTSLLESGALPYATDLLFHPDGTSLAFHTHSEANVLLSLPVSLVAGPVAALNFATLLGFALAGWGGYLLARELVDDRRAAFIAGMVFTFFPQHFEQSLEHLNLASYGAMPLFLLALVKACRQGTVLAWGLAAAAFAVNSLFSWHNSVLILPCAVLLFVREAALGYRSRKSLIIEAVLAGAFAALLVLPFAWPMLHEILAGETYYQKPKPPLPKSIDLLFLFLPAENHSLWGAAVSPLYTKLRTYPSVGFTGYLGWSALALAAFAWIRRGKEPRKGEAPAYFVFPLLFWTAVFALYVLLSFGDELRVAGVDTGLPMPYALLGDLPLIETTRVPNRFLVPALLALSLVAAAGVKTLLRGARRPRLVLGVVGLLVLLDYAWLPYPLRAVPRPEWTAHVAEAPPGALLNIPGGDRARASRDMFLQTYHRRPIVGGYVSCSPPHVQRRVLEYPFLETVFRALPTQDIRSSELRQKMRRVLDQLPIGVVAVHLNRTREDLERRRENSRGRPEARLYNPDHGIPEVKMEEIRRYLEELWGKPYYRDARVKLYGRPAEE